MLPLGKDEDPQGTNSKGTQSPTYLQDGRKQKRPCYNLTSNLSRSYLPQGPSGESYFHKVFAVDTAGKLHLHSDRKAMLWNVIFYSNTSMFGMVSSHLSNLLLLSTNTSYIWLYFLGVYERLQDTC